MTTAFAASLCVAAVAVWLLVVLGFARWRVAWVASRNGIRRYGIEDGPTLLFAKGTGLLVLALIAVL